MAQFSKILYIFFANIVKIVLILDEPTIEYRDQDARNNDFYVCTVGASIFHPGDRIDEDISMNVEIPIRSHERFVH